MATNLIQINCLRRLLALILPVLLAGCISSQPFPEGVIIPQPLPVPAVRAPKVGQEWVYQVRNVFNQEIVDTVTEKVVSVGTEIRIARSGVKSGQLPDEIQSPWGVYIARSPLESASKISASHSFVAIAATSRMESVLQNAISSSNIS